MSEEQTQLRTSASTRLRFVLGERGIDIAVPAVVPLVDLLPAVLPQFGAEVVEDGADHEGWVAQRLGEASLDEDLSVGELGLHDGDLLYLRPRGDQLAPIDYDDIVDGVGEQVRRHPGAWTAARSRTALRGAAVAVLLLGIPLLLGAGIGPLTLGLSAGLSVLLLAGAALVARGAAEPVSATVLAGVAASYAAVTGALTMILLDPVATLAMTVAAAGAAALVALVIGLVLVADAALLFTGAITVSAVLVLAGLIGTLAPVPLAQAAAITMVITLVAGILVPSLSFRLSGLTLPLLPTSAEELTDEIEPVPHRLVVERGAATVGYSSALHLGIGAAQLLLIPQIVPAGDAWSITFVLVVALLMVLRARHPDGSVARWSILAPAGVAVAASVFELAGQQDPTGRLLAYWLPALAVGGLLLLLSDRLPGRRLRPYWGRAAEIAELLAAIAVVPVLLAVLDVYTFMRGLTG